MELSSVFDKRIAHSQGKVKPGFENSDERTPEAVAVVINRAEGPGKPGPSPISALVSEQTLGGVGGQSPPSGGGDGGRYYKDSVAKSATPTCGAWAVVSECSSGLHHFAKKLVCGKEWCEVCGQGNSAAHRRRQARILPKLQQVRQLGYFVIEFPDVYRNIGAAGFEPDIDGGERVEGWCYSKADLRDTTKTIVDVLAGKRCGRRGRVGGYFGRGLARWHWFGDICMHEKRITKKFVRCQLTGKQCILRRKKPAEDCSRFENNGKYNPHCNVLVDGEYLEPELLEGIKAALRQALNVPDLIISYSYFDKPGQMVQKGRYITRATFLQESWSPYMANELWNFRNMRWWGTWVKVDKTTGKLPEGVAVWELLDAAAEGEDVEGLEAVASLQGGVCPDCGQPLKVLYHQPDYCFRKVHTKSEGDIVKRVVNLKAGQPVRWSRPVDSTYLGIWGAEEIAGSGYYRIPHREWRGYSFSPGELLDGQRALELPHYVHHSGYRPYS